MKHINKIVVKEAPSYFRILLSKYFYLEFIENLRQNIVYEIFILSLFVIFGFITNDYQYPIVAISLYILLSIILSALRFRNKVQILMNEELLENLKSKKVKAGK